MAMNAMAGIQEYERLLGPSLRAAAKNALPQMKAFEKKVLDSDRIEDKKAVKKQLDKETTYDIATVIDLMRVVREEEGSATYEEFMGLIVSLLNSVFYAQSRRKNIHFPKYKALFDMIAQELKQDTDRKPGLFRYENGNIWFCTKSIEHKLEE